MELSGKVALVTGAGRRVGRALAVALGRRGAAVAVHYNATDRGAQECAAEIRAAGGRADVFKADLTNAKAPADLVAAVVKAFGRLDVLVNSAAIMVRTPFGETTADQWDEIL